ncbi:MAG: hypothetical protein ACRDKI_04705 [Solirubrobacterales bacterium]
MTCSRAIRRLLLCAALACSAALVLTSPALAVPRIVAHSRDYIERVVIDGTNVYWVASAELHRTDLTTGADSVIYSAPGNGYIAEIAAGGGRVSARSFISRAHSIIERLATGDPAGPLHVVATASSRDYKKGSCGSSLLGGRITPEGTEVYAKTYYTRTRKHCTGKWKYKTRVLADDRPTTPGVLPTPRLLYTSKLSFPFDPQLVGRTLLLQNTRTFEIVNLDTRAVVRKRALGKSTIYGELDPSANLITNRLPFSSDNVTSSIATAASNYTTGGTLTGRGGNDWFYPCGGRLVNTHFGNSATIDAVPNPFAPLPGAAQTILPATKIELGSFACTSTRVTFTAYPRIGSDVYVDDFIG